MTTPLTQINALVTNELIARVADVLGSRHDFRVDHPTWRPYCICGWRAENPYDVAAYDRHLAVTVLEASAPIIAARAWEQGYAASQQEWAHVYDGHTVEPDDLHQMCTTCGQGNPYERKDER